MSDLLTLTQAAQVACDYSINRSQIAYAVKAGQIAVVKRRKKYNLGAPVKYRIERSVLMQWINERIQPMPDDFMTVADAAAEANISIRTLYDAIEHGRLEYAERSHRGKRLRLYVKLADVLAYKTTYGVRQYHT